MMIKFNHVNVYNWMNAIRGMRNSWESWAKSDSVEVNGEILIGPADNRLMETLAKAGPEHAKYLRQIFVSVDITAPLKWWDECDTYHFFETNSTSAMHTLGKEYITQDAFSFEDMDEDILDAYMDLLNVQRMRWELSGKKKPSREWRALVMMTGMGLNYTRTFTSNYAQLRTMYHQRNKHRLEEWIELCKWIETLPYSEFITGKIARKVGK